MSQQWREGDKDTSYCKGKKIPRLGNPRLHEARLYQIRSSNGDNDTHLYSSTQDEAEAGGLGASVSLIT